MKRLLATAVLSIAGCAAAATVNDSMLVSASWLTRHRHDRGLTVVHVGQSPASYEAGHVPGAVFLPAQSLLARRGTVPNELPQLDDLTRTFRELGIGERGKIVIYGDEPLAAGRLFFTLDHLGHGGRAALLDGGLPAWTRAGFETESGRVTPASREFTPRVQPDRLVTLGQMKKVAGSPGMTLIDARPPEQYRGDDPGDGVPRGGRIPGARNVYWKTHLAEDGTLLPPDALHRLYASAGVREDQPVIVYCRTGMQSSHTYFVLRYLGYDASMYDGSFLEWSNDPSTPVE